MRGARRPQKRGDACGLPELFLEALIASQPEQAETANDVLDILGLVGMRLSEELEVSVVMSLEPVWLADVGLA